MKQNFRMGAQEAIGLGIVGATIGAVLCGAAVSEITLRVALGAIVGGAVLPTLIFIRWNRLLRARALVHPPRRAPN